MKKSTKILLIILGIVIVLGLGAVIFVSRYYGGVRADIVPPEGYVVNPPIESGNYPVKNLGAQMSFGEDIRDCGFVSNWKVNPKLEEDIKKGTFSAENIRWRLNLYVSEQHWDIGGAGRYSKELNYNQQSWSSGMRRDWCQKEIRFIVETIDLQSPNVFLGKTELKFFLAPAYESGTPGTGACAPRNLKAYPHRQIEDQSAEIKNYFILTWDRPEDPNFQPSAMAGKGYVYFVFDGDRQVEKEPDTSTFSTDEHIQSDPILIGKSQVTLIVKAFHYTNQGMANTSCGEAQVIIKNYGQDNNSVGYPDSGGQPGQGQGGITIDPKDPCGCESKTGWFRRWFTVSGALEYALCKVTCFILDALGFFFDWTLNFLWGAAGVS